MSRSLPLTTGAQESLRWPLPGLALRRAQQSTLCASASCFPVAAAGDPAQLSPCRESHAFSHTLCVIPSATESSECPSRHPNHRKQVQDMDPGVHGSLLACLPWKRAPSGRAHSSSVQCCLLAGRGPGAPATPKMAGSAWLTAPGSGGEPFTAAPSPIPTPCRSRRVTGLAYLGAGGQEAMVGGWSQFWEF